MESKKVYQITKFNLIGKVIYTHKLMPELEEIIDHNKRAVYVYKKTKDRYPEVRLWKMSTSLPSNSFNKDEYEFLPYFADVTEDLPSSVKLQPKTYKNCQLMTETHGGYLQFYHKETKQILRIAMNSHTYYPVTNSPSLT